MKILKTALVFSLGLFSSATLALTLSGQVLDESQQRLKNVEVTIAGKRLKTDINGAFSQDLAKQDTYRLSFHKQGYYPSVQTLSHHELTLALRQGLAPVTLVKKQQGRVMFAFGGDVMMGRRYSKPYFGDQVLIDKQNAARQTKEIVKHIRPYMQLADYAVVNLETQVATHTPDERAPKSVTFITPPEALDALHWAGVDYVTLGNNHTYDYLDSGLSATIKHLELSPLDYSGAGKDQHSALKAHVETLAGTSYAMLGYVGWEGNFSPTQTADVHKGGAAYGSMQNILQSVTREVNAGHQPIVQYHGSLEYKDEPSTVTEQRLKSALDAGAVMAIAHHPHVAQGFELYKDKLIAYSMGNFVFDQFFYATPHSFVLYVWMDAGKFHRAEIVPVYLKGYKPTPATGSNRYNTMRRLTTLSARRGIEISASGGHGVISKQKLVKQDLEFELLVNNQQTVRLSHLPWQAEIQQVKTSGLAYRLGIDLTNGGDFESFHHFDSPERGWAFDKTSGQIEEATGNKLMQLTLNQKGQSHWQMKNFRRVFKPGSPMTFTARVKVNKPVELSVYWQGRKTRQKLFDALDNGNKHLVDRVKVTPEQGWLNLDLAFNSPRVGFRSFRVLLEATGKQGSELLLDDVAVVEWQSAYTKQVMPVYSHSGIKQASHIGFKQLTNAKVTLNTRSF